MSYTHFLCSVSLAANPLVSSRDTSFEALHFGGGRFGNVVHIFVDSPAPLHTHTTTTPPHIDHTYSTSLMNNFKKARDLLINL